MAAPVGVRKVPVARPALAGVRHVAALCLVTLLPLAAWTPFYDCFPLTKWLVLVGMAAVVLTAGGFLPRGPSQAWLAIWVAWLGIAVWRSVGPLWEAAPAALLLAVPPLVAAAAVAATRGTRLARALLLTALLMAMHGLAQVLGWDEGAWLSPFHKGVASTIGNPDLLGGFLILPFALALAIALDRPGALTGTAAVLLGAVMLATEARAAWLAAAAAAAVLTIRRGRQAAALAAVALAVAGLWIAATPGALARARSAGALTERIWTWNLASRIVRDAPVAGFGPGSFRTQYLERQSALHDQGETFYHYTEYAHLEPLHLWAELGAVGLGLFCWGVISAGRGWWRGPLRRREPTLWRGIGAGAAGVLVNATLSFPFHVAPTAVAFWLLLGSADAPVSEPSSSLRVPPARRLVALALAALLLALPFRQASENAALRDGQILALAGRLDLAAERYRVGTRAMEADPRLAWYAASCAREQGDPARALTLIDGAIRLEPGMYELHHERGMTLKAMGRLGEAEAAYRKAVRINPGFASGWNNLGNLLGASGRLAEAEVAQRRALALDPAAREARQNLAITLLREGRRREARDVLERGL